MSYTFSCKKIFNKTELLLQFTLLLFILINSSKVFSQEERLVDNNTIAWIAYTGTFKIKPKISLHTEYQWRRVDGFKHWQQSLIRVGLNYAVRNDISLNVGYAFAETIKYGEYPAAFAFPEHRIFEQILINNPIGKVNISHRFTLEQRFVGQVVLENQVENTSYNFLNRARYRFRAEFPFGIMKDNGKPWYLVFQDELFINFGKQVRANVFDQNRIAILLGLKLNSNIKLEAGYLNQTLQQARRVNNSAVFQYNNGFLISANFTIDTTR